MSTNQENANSEGLTRGEGVTESERYLAQLCDRTFLSLWSYPGVYRDQGVDQRGEGKEVCDLLVVFDKHIIIFSDKDCDFPDSGRLDVDWNRWFKKAIFKSAQQAWGAERWIRSHPDRLYLDRACTQPFPFEFPSMDEATFHLIVVAHDKSGRCKVDLGGSGSLMFNSTLTKEDHYVRDGSRGMPFMVGDLDPSRTFIHVLDDTSLDIVLGGVDTISDFTKYLAKKESFVRSAKEVFAAGEEDLLAFYLKDINDDGEHDFVVPDDTDAIFLEEGHWEDFQARPERQAQLEADRISYVWDHLIETFSKHAVEGTQFFSSHEGVEYTEQVLRIMAREPRFYRRMLSRGFVDLVSNTSEEKHATRYAFSPDQTLLYVFQVFPQMEYMKPYESYRNGRMNHLELTCLVAKLKFPRVQHIVGIATEPGIGNEGRSEDALYFDAREWTPEMEREAKEAQEKLGILKSPKMYRVSDDEYPDPPNQRHRPVAPALSKNPRNKPCPCGSGRKYKHCHGRH